jgi:hypothetical protein
MSEQTTGAPYRIPLSNEWLSVAETLAVFGIADRTLRKWVARGRLHREFGSDGRPRYRREEVERLLAGEPPLPPLSEREPEGGHPPRFGASRVPTDAAERLGDSEAARKGAERQRWENRSTSEHRAKSASGASQEREQSEPRERQLLAEIAWLRERLTQAQEAEREYRLLLLQSTRTIEALGERAAVAAVAPSIRARSGRLRSRPPAP